MPGNDNKKKPKQLKDLLEETKRSFWGADTQTVDKFLNEMELVLPENKQPVIAEPGAAEIEMLFRDGNGKNRLTPEMAVSQPKLLRKDCRVEKERVSVACRNERNIVRQSERRGRRSFRKSPSSSEGSLSIEATPTLRRSKDVGQPSKMFGTKNLIVLSPTDTLGAENDSNDDQGGRPPPTRGKSRADLVASNSMRTGPLARNLKSANPSRGASESPTPHETETLLVRSDTAKSPLDTNSVVPNAGEYFQSKEEQHVSAHILFRLLRTKVTFLKDATDKDLKAIAYAKPPRISFHQFRVGERIYHAGSYAEEMYIIA